MYPTTLGCEQIQAGNRNETIRIASGKILCFVVIEKLVQEMDSEGSILILNQFKGIYFIHGF